MDIKFEPQEIRIKRLTGTLDRYEAEIQCDGIIVKFHNCCFEHHRDGLYIRVMKDDNSPVLMTLVSVNTSL